MKYLVGTWSFTTAGGNTGNFEIEKTALDSVHTVKVLQSNGEIIVIGIFAWDKGSDAIHIARGTANDAKVFTFSQVTEDRLLTDDEGVGYYKIDADNLRIEVAEGEMFARLTRKK
jgi:hypothetical protein